MKFLDQFKAAQRVSTPLLAIRTFDAKSAIERIKALYTSTSENPAVIVWDCVKGLAASNKHAENELSTALNYAQTTADLTASLPEALRVCNHFVQGSNGSTGEDCIIFISNAHLHLEGNERVPIIQGIWNLRDKFKAQGNMLILLTSNGAILPNELANDFLIIDEPLPTADDLRAIITDLYKWSKLEVKLTAEILEESVKALIGLPAFPAEQSAAMCLDSNTGILDIAGLWERKRQAVNQTRGLQVLQTDADLDNIGGLEQFKQYLEQVMNGKDSPNVILVWDEIEKSFAGMGTDTSGTTTKMGGNVLSWSQDTGMRGCIGVGVPGAGKTEIAKAIANKYGKLCIAFNLADMESGIVGSSNEYLRNAQAVIDSISDKKVLSIATCNKIDSLPAEIQRRFATEGIFFFDAPTEIERESIWKVYRRKYSIAESDVTPVDKGWTGAEIKNCAMKAYRLNIPLKQAANYIVPVTQSNASTIDVLRRSCSGKYLSASYAGVYKYEGQGDALDAQESVQYTGRKMR